jgi:hypothetical protein
MTRNYDCRLFQRGLDRLQDWYGKKKSMSKFISFSRGSKPGSFLEGPDKIRNLGVLSDYRITFLDHIELIVSKLEIFLGFTKTWSMQCVQ